MSDEKPQDNQPDTEQQPSVDKRANQRRGLLPPIKPGEVRNKTGKNGREARAALSQFLEEPSETDKGKTRFRRVLEKLYAKAIAGDTQAARTLVEQHAGKPQQALDLSSEDGTLRPKILEVRWVQPKPNDQPTLPPPASDGTGTNRT
jgi:hypothetical protein